jgi:cysteine sulfinate desulfinase/cysteine desulfurase-like protein
MHVPPALAKSAIRVSFGKNNSMTDVHALLTALSDIIETNQHSPVMMASNV